MCYILFFIPFLCLRSFNTFNELNITLFICSLSASSIIHTFSFYICPLLDILGELRTKEKRQYPRH